jgi:hypothetical protein
MASIKKRLAAAVAAAGLALGLGGCMGDYGYGGVGYASDYYGDYGGYGYGPSLAYGGYGGYGGWYNDFYYPGQGIYVFDRSGRRSRWNDGQRRYWEGRRGQWQGQGGEGRRAEWNGRRSYARPDGQRGAGQRADGQRWQGRPGVNRPDGVPGSQGTTGRGQWRGNRQPGAVPNATVGAQRPTRQGYTGQWRGRGGASMGTPSRAPRFEGRSFGGGGAGRMGAGRSRGGGGNRPH